MQEWCSIPGCKRRAKSKGWCNAHYLKWWKYGDPLYVKKHGLRKRDEDLKSPYRMARRHGRIIPLHREIMEKEIGRPLLRKEIVHHKDENTHNNDPSNLELFPSQSEHATYHNYNRRT